MSVSFLQMSEFLQERPERITPDQANSSGLKRLEKIDFKGNIHTILDKPTKTNMIRIKNGDLVISGINAEKGAIAVYEDDEDLTATIHYSSYTYDKKKIDIDYLKWLLKSRYFANTLLASTKGGIKTEIKPKTLLKLKVNLPDIETQRESAARLNKIDDDISELKRINSDDFRKYELLRGSVLERAVKGGFSIPDSTQSASDELSELGIDYDSPSFLPFDIPDNWVWCTLDSLVDSSRGITYGIIKLGTEPRQGVPTLRCSDVKFRYIDTTKVRLVDDSLSSQYSRTVLQGGELLMNIRGTLGGCAIVPSEMEGFNIAREVAMIPLVDGIDKDYILNVLTSPYFVASTYGNLRGTAYKGLNLGILRQLPVPLPPLKEQLEINKRVTELLVDIDEVEKVAAAQLKTIKKLAVATVDAEIQRSFVENVIAEKATNQTFSIQQAIAAILSKNFNKGEMVIAKVLYLVQEVYGVKIGINFTPQYFGPYDASVKKALTSGMTTRNSFFKNKGTKDAPFYSLETKGSKLVTYTLAQETLSVLDDLLPRFSKAESRDIERLATVCKIVQDNKTTDEETVLNAMFAWKKDKFTDQEIKKSLSYAIQEGWDKQLLGRN